MINFNLTTAQLKPEIIGKAISEIVPLSAIEKAISQTNSEQKRDRILPTKIIILLVRASQFLVKGFGGRCVEKFGGRIDV